MAIVVPLAKPSWGTTASTRSRYHHQRSRSTNDYPVPYECLTRHLSALTIDGEDEVPINDTPKIRTRQHRRCASAGSPFACCTSHPLALPVSAGRESILKDRHTARSRIIRHSKEKQPPHHHHLSQLLNLQQDPPSQKTAKKKKRDKSNKTTPPLHPKIPITSLIQTITRPNLSNMAENTRIAKQDTVTGSSAALALPETTPTDKSRTTSQISNNPKNAAVHHDVDSERDEEDTATAATSTRSSIGLWHSCSGSAESHHHNSVLDYNVELSTDEAMTMKSWVQGVVHVVENVQEQHRRAQCRKRISQTLLTLRAATEVHYELEEQKRQKRRCSIGEEAAHAVAAVASDQKNDDDYSSEEEEDCWGLGAALLRPLDPPPIHHHHAHPTTDQTTIARPCTPEPERETPKSEEKEPVQILPEPESMLLTNPRLLTQAMFQQLVDEGVPECLHMNAWERIFSIGRDGDSFYTLLEHCAPYRHSILVIQTTTGHLLGGFVSDAWQEQDVNRHSYYGTGVSFLFANHPAGCETTTATANGDKPLTIFPWTGSNDFCQICDKDKSILAMGGSGAFGFILEDDFYKGSTDRCGTFGNPPLTPDRDGLFHVASMEVYGLVPYGLLQNVSIQSPRSTVDPGTFNAAKSLIGHNVGDFY